MASAELTLELVAHGPKQEQILPIFAYVQKYIEEFLYLKEIKDNSTPLTYYESDPIDSWKNLQIINKTYILPANELDFIGGDDTWTEISGRSYSSQYKEVALTTTSTLEESGRIKPLFYKHELPNDTVEASLEEVSSGNKSKIESGFSWDIENNLIYTNYKNFFDPDTGSYRLFFVVSSNSEGETTHELLSPIQATKEATWEDILLTGSTAGSLTEEYPVYSREKNADGYTFYLNQNATWYARPLESSTIKALKPSGRDPDNAWNIAFTNGDFTTLTNGRTRRYYVPEYDTQPFAPYKPYIYAPYRKMLYVNSNILFFTRKNTAVSIPDNRHITIYGYDDNGILKVAYSTDAALEGKRAFKREEADVAVVANAKNIFYEGDKIISVDNTEGFVLLSTSLDPEYTYYASFFYEAKSLEYTSLNLNPISNKEVLEHMYVFYMHPDANSNDKAIHYLKVDRCGEIVYTSQNEGRDHTNLQTFNADGTTNNNTVIGMKYNSFSDENSFVKEFCCPFPNDNAYYVLCEVTVMEAEHEDDSFIVNVSQDGAIIKNDRFEKAIRSNQKILQSSLGYGPMGQEVPENGVLLLNAPITLLEDYGGPFNKAAAEKALKRYTNQSVYTIIDWVYEKALLTGHSDIVNNAKLAITWEGPSLIYRIYRKQKPLEQWELIDSIENPPEGDIEYNDTDLVSGKKYFYSCRIEKDGVLLPHSNSLSLMVR